MAIYTETKRFIICLFNEKRNKEEYHGWNDRENENTMLHVPKNFRDKALCQRIKWANNRQLLPGMPWKS